MKSYKEKIEEYLSLGGCSKIAKQLSIESLANKSRLFYLISQLPKPAAWIPEAKADLDPVMPDPVDPEPVFSELTPVIEKKGVFTDLLCQYPAELHSIYKKRYESWLEACSLKIQLNEVDPVNSEGALFLQKKILQCFDFMDKYQKALDHYNQNKRILIIESDKNFSELSQAEIVLKRNNIRTNITKRKKTIKKQQDTLPPEGNINFMHKLNMLNQKIEDLQLLENQEAELNGMIK